MDPELPEDWQSSQCGSVLNTAFEMPKGKSSVTYHFHYVAYDEDGYDVATHSIKVEDPSPLPEDPTDPPPDVPDPPQGDYGALIKASKAQLAIVNDPVTQQQLAAAISGVTPKETVKDTAASVQQAIETTLLMRGDEQRKYNWIPWRTAVNNEIQKLQITSVSQYVSILEVIVNTLNATIQQIPSLTVFVTENCYWCNYWKENDLPKMTGWNITFVTSGARLYPSYIINYNGRTTSYTGYTTSNILKQHIQ